MQRQFYIAALCQKGCVKKMAPPNTDLGEMKESFIALNVHACEVSCRAGTIKCSRERFKRRALAPIRQRRKFGSPAGPAQAKPFGRQKLRPIVMKLPSKNQVNSGTPFLQKRANIFFKLVCGILPTQLLNKHQGHAV